MELKPATLGLAVLWCCSAAQGYSVLTHEAIVDAAWDISIKPVLLARFPQATPAELVEAHSNAYAGCIIQDMGYYPFGSRFFSDLVHYVRSGDFIVNLVRDSATLNEYAFALGAMAHYAADTEGHSIAVNRAVALQYPKLKRKYGASVTYADNRSAHIQVEFGFDVLQVARGNYAPQAFHDYIGFHVARELLQRAFHDTYSLDLADLFGDLDLALGTYRHTVSSTIPAVTRATWSLRKKELKKAQPGVTRGRFVYNLSRASYRREWNNRFQQPGIGIRIVAFMLRILPKSGPLKALAFRPPTTQTERLFEGSFDRALGVYRTLLRDQATGTLAPANRDFDTGELTGPGEYRMADAAYATLAVKLASHDGVAIDPQLRQNILTFYRDPDMPFATKQDAAEWRRTLTAVDKLKARPAGTP